MVGGVAVEAELKSLEQRREHVLRGLTVVGASSAKSRRTIRATAAHTASQLGT
jgi:hypothetical protein